MASATGESSGVIKPDHAAGRKHFIFSQEHEDLRESMQAWVKAELWPHRNEWEETYWPTSALRRAGENRVEFRIGKRRVLALERALRQAGFASLEDPGPSGCADCFEYEIRYRGHSLEVDESEMPPALEPVIGELEAIVTAHAIPPNA